VKTPHRKKSRILRNITKSWAGFIRPWAGTTSSFLSARQWVFRFHKMWEICRKVLKT